MASMDIDSPTTPMMAITPVEAEDNDETPLSVEQPNKRRRKKSIVWEHFTIETVDAGCMRACCKQCKKSFAYITGSKLAGTSHLKRHIALGICPVSRQKNEANQFVSGVKSDPPKRRYRTSPALGSIPFDQDRCNQDVAKMIIQHEYPLHIVEHPAFIDFVRTLQPQYNMVSFNTIQGECVALYLREKQGLSNLISGIPGRVNISLDLRTSNLNVGYAFLTGHFIDTDWNLHRRILNVVMLPFPESEYAFNQAVVSCISDWHLERRLFTLTLDQSVSNDNIIRNLRGALSVKHQLMFNGQLVKGNCYARVLSRLAQDSLGATGEVVRRIRESVKYVKTSDTHDEKFSELRQRLQVPSTRELIIDDQTKWDTTYQMLVAACELKEVFSCLDTTDPFYKINPSMDDWKQVEILCTYLKLFYDAASILTGPMYPPANAFYHEVSKIQLELTHAAMSQDPFVSNLARPLKEKFDQYWRDCFLVLAIAIVMDPRFKMKLVEFSFSRIFGEDAGMWIKIVDDGIHELFLDYLPPSLSMPTTYMEAGNTSISHSDIFREASHQEVAPQEAGFQGLEVMHHADAQGATIEELQPEEVTPLEQPKEELLQDPSPEVMNNHEVARQEMRTEEVVLVQETQTQDLPLQEDRQEVVKGMDSQEAETQEMESQEGATQEMNSQIAATQEMNGQVSATQEMGNEEVPAKEMDSQEAPEQQMVIQDVTMQEMQHIAEVPVQEKHVEGGPIEETVEKEVSPEKVLAEGRVPTEEIQAQEMTEEMQHQENLTHEMQAQDGTTPDMHAEEKMTSEMDVQEKPNADMVSEEKPTQEVDAPEKPTDDVHALEKSTDEMPVQEVMSEDMHACEVQEIKLAERQTDEIKLAGQTEDMEVGQEMKLAEEKAEEIRPSEGQTGEMEVGQEMKLAEGKTEEIKSSEGHTEEMEVGQEIKLAEGQTEEIKPSEGQTEEMEVGQEMKLSEAPIEEIKTSEGQTEEIKPSEVQTEIKVSEMQTEEMQTSEVQAEEIETSEVQTEEIKPSKVLIEEIKVSEVQTEELQTSEVQAEEMQTSEVQAEEIKPSEVQIEEIKVSEVQTEEMQTSEVQTEEMQTSEVQAEEMQTSEVQAEEIKPSEVQIEEIKVSEVHTEEVQTSEVQTEEMQTPEVQTQEMKPAGEQIQEMQPAEEQSQEMHPQEGQVQEMHPQEGQVQEMHPPAEKSREMNLPEAQTNETHEMHVSEEQAQEMQPPEKEIDQFHSQEAETNGTREMHVSEEQAQEMQPPEKEIDQFHSQEAEAHEMHSQGAETHTMHSQEAQTHQMQLEEEQAHQMNLQAAHTHEVQLEEAQNHEMQPQDLQSQDMHFQEVQYHDQHHHEAIHNQEMHSQGIQAQDMEYQAMSHEMHTQDLPLLSIGDGLQDFEVYISEIANSQHLKSELDQYLEESLLPRVQDFDVLGWWKLNKLKYPTLSKMAADILSIPVSTVAPESVFDIRSKKVDSYQSSLRPVTLEALVCAKDWLQYGSSASSLDTMSNALVKMEY